MCILVIPGKVDFGLIDGPFDADVRIIEPNDEIIFSSLRSCNLVENLDVRLDGHKTACLFGMISKTPSRSRGFTSTIAELFCASG